MPRLRTVLFASCALTAVAWMSASASPAAERDVRRDVQRALAAKDVRERTDLLDAALKGADDEGAAEAVLELVFSEDAPQMVLDVGVRALGRMASSGAQDAVTRALAKPQRLRRILAAEALGRSATDASRQQLASLSRTDDVRVRTAAVNALGDRREGEASAALRAAIDDPEWTVRSAAIRGIRALGDASMAPLLVERESKETGRLLDDLGDALRDIGRPARKADDAAPPARPPATLRAPLFETRSRRILFVLSTGETMKDPVQSGVADAAVAAAVARAGDDLAKDLASAKTKLELARVHLRAMIRALADGVEFDVMTYSGSPVFAFGQLTRADDASRKKAESRIARLSPGGPPDLHDALLRIFDPRGRDPFEAEDGADTVVLLSDGALPTTGGVSDRTEVAPRAVRWDRVRQIRFIAIAVGQAEPSVIGALAGGPPPGLSLSIP